ncbi:MAG TPA: Gfo/Idh/MocA family oxidoreductase, partial [Polyangia bacterium]|nr:Gfo/Idh/MocA family oxidoreductase [Polyangia bacterium]
MARRRSAGGRRRRAAKVRFAVVGQGHFAQTAILPAFAHTKRAELTAIFSDDETKLAALRRKVRVEHALPYAQLDEFLRSGAVDAVYIAVTNDRHAEFTERAAAAGVHVLCEKPMASSSAHAQRMIAACQRARVKLMIAYRLHFDEANLAAVEIIKSGKIGDPRYLSAIFSQQVTPGNTRTQRAHAGGPLRDIGIYCINAARYLFRDEPLEVTALAGTKAGDPRFREVDEQVSALLRFPGDPAGADHVQLRRRRRGQLRGAGNKRAGAAGAGLRHVQPGAGGGDQGQDPAPDVQGPRSDRARDRRAGGLHPRGARSRAVRPGGAGRPARHRGDRGG